MISRRQFAQGLAALAAAATVTGCSTTPASAPSASTAAGTRGRFLDQVKHIEAGELTIGYAELGPATGPPVILLHGWPYDIQSFGDVAPELAKAGYRVLVPYLRGYGPTTFRSAGTVRNGQQAAVASDVIAFMDALRIDKAVLGGFDWGARTVCCVAALWPERVKALVSVSGYLITNLPGNLQPLPPAAELGWWYQYYFSTERGVQGYSRNRHDFNKLIWQQASPRWRFDEATYERSAKSWENPDHVAIVVHNYRWRLSLAQGEARFEELERRLAAMPVISVPTVTVASDFDGAAIEGTAYRKQFSGKYEHRILRGIGHNVPQEAPEAFTQAVIAADKL
ncbi:pimeloyl-ACP methyl ester carboxylesterase [Crossiella equi]|uniref:Pimeloyl-ACP methyl ester carboxylesterase n=1 Tax=Crossiella equi TaxID=130796 RepID=A0ABS5AMH1_9PSEU|nr:alpha/beta hydrolase [Crossiella equi]MBP2477772.1 pimeloyl-ACP methyl ester carboxylesterase [Crossiella equi]